MFLVLWSVMFLLVGCSSDDDLSDEADQLQQAYISSADANQLILDGRSEIGTVGGQCKEWVREVVQYSYGPYIPSTDATYQYKWVNDSTPATNVARWLGSYTNGRLGPITLNGYATGTPVSFNVPNADPQAIVVYASHASVTATMTKSGSTTLSVTSTGTAGGTVSSSTTIGQGSWTLTVTNGSGTQATGVVAVVLSRSRFQSDWQTARRGDMMQMYVATSSSRRDLGGPHTTFIQTDYNANGTCVSGGDTTGCNWLDSNWVSALVVGVHNVSMNDMMKMTAYSSSYGFTVYRLN